MTLLLSAFWPGLAGAAALGGLVGFFSGWPAGKAVLFGLLGLILLLMLLAVFRVVPGAAGFWLDGAALILPVYLAGCALGALGNRTSSSGR